MADKKLKTRIQLKHDTAANWSQATNFIPLIGEIIIYDADTTNSAPRVKIGDGKTVVAALPFISNADEITTAIAALDANDPSASGTSTTFISTVSQTDGVISATKSSIPTASSTTLGMVKGGGDVTISSGVITVTDNSHKHTSANISDLGTTIETAINNAVEALDVSEPAASGTSTTFIATAKQTNGVIEVTKASIPTANGTTMGMVKQGGDVTIASGVITVNDDSHNHVISNVDGLQTALDAKATPADITSAISALDASDPAASGTATQFITSVSQKDGVITATKANITAAALGLSGAMKFLGTSATAISDGATTNPITIGTTSTTVAAGNVVLYGAKEFVWTGSKWEELGNEGSYKVQQSAVSSPSASGNATAFIDSISQNAQGVITATKKNVTFPTLSGGSAAGNDATVVGGVTVSGHAVTVGKKTLTAGSNVTITGGTDSITIAAKDTTYTLGSFGITATAAELNKMDGVTATTAELNYVDGVTSNIQTQLNGKVSLTGANMSGSIYTVNDSGEVDIGVGHGSGEYLYLYGNKSLGTRGCYDTTWGNVFYVTDTGASFNGTSTGIAYHSDLTTQAALDAFHNAGILEASVFSFGSNENNVSFAGNDGMVVSIPWKTNMYGAQLAIDDTTAATTKIRILSNGTWLGWKTVAFTDSNISGNAATATTLNGLTATIAELNYTDGVTSNIQTQLNGKVPTSRTVNGKALSSNISLTYSDVGADASGKLTPVAITANVDLDNYTSYGWYYCPADATVATLSNCPTACAFFLEVGRHAGIYQRLVEYITRVPKVYFRNYYNGAWGAWQREYTTVDKPTASDVGALPLSGGTLTGSLWAQSTGEVDIGINYASGKSLYLYGNYSIGTRGLYDSTVGTVISVTNSGTTFYGNATTATAATTASKLGGTTLTTTTQVDSLLEAGVLKFAPVGQSATTIANDGVVVSIGFDATYGAQMWLDDGSGAASMQIRNRNASGWNSWARVLTENNYSSFAVPTSRTVNGKALSSNISLSATDVDAVPMISNTSSSTNVIDANAICDTSLRNVTGGYFTNTPGSYGYGQLLTMAYRKHSGNTTPDYATQIFMHNGGSAGDNLYFRTSSSTEYLSWRKVLHDNNYSSYALPLSGGTLTGNLTVSGTTSNAWLRATNNTGTIYLESAASGNRGLYDNSAGWIIYADTSNAVKVGANRPVASNVLRNISGGTSALTSGSSALTTGDIYIQYV